MMRSSSALAVLACLGLAACGESPTAPPVLDCEAVPVSLPDELAVGEFEARVTGSEETTLSGSAASRTGTSHGAPAWLVDLDEGLNEIFLRVWGEGRPTPGTYPLLNPAFAGPDSTAAFTFDLVQGERRRLFSSVVGRGTLTLDQVTETSAQGRLTAQASGSGLGGFGPVCVFVAFHSEEGGDID